MYFFFFQAEDGIRDKLVTGVQTCALPISCGVVQRATGEAVGNPGSGERELVEVQPDGGIELGRAHLYRGRAEPTRRGGNAEFIAEYGERALFRDNWNAIGARTFHRRERHTGITARGGGQ